MDALKQRATISLFSSYASQFATTFINLATKIIIARLIAPDDVGLFALALFILLGGDMLVDMGIPQHMIREERRPYGNFLLLRLIVSTVFFFTIQLVAPVFVFWGEGLPAILRVISIVVVIKAVSTVPLIFLDRELLIHKSLLPQFARISTMGLVSIGLAYFGYGVWSLVWGTIAAEIVFATLMWNAVRGRIPLEFTWRYTGRLIWGSKYLFLIGIMGFALQQGDVAIIGSLLSPREVGFYTMAYMLVIQVSNVVETAVFRVIYPVFCEYRSNLKKLGETYRQATLAITAIEAPIYFFLLFNAPPLVLLLLGEKWMPAALILQALSVFGIINPFSTFGNEVLRATKRDAILTLSTVLGAVILLTSGYILTSRYGTMGMVAANYIMLGSLPTIITVYKIIKADFIKLAGQLAIVYSTSFAVIAAASLFLPFTPMYKALVTGLLVPVCWYTYYRVFGNGFGRTAMSTLATVRSARTAKVSEPT